MAIWELIVEGMSASAQAGQPWLIDGEIVNAVRVIAPETNPTSIRPDINFHCINDPSKKHSPGLRYLKNPRLITDDPTMRGKRYRLLTEDERRSFLASPRDDLEQFSYTQVLEWLREPSIVLTVADGGPADDNDDLVEELAGPALLELHMQDYLHRNWEQHFPRLTLYEGANGREYVTRDPGVGTIDFLATDSGGDFVVIETKRNLPDRQAIGQILGYMGWVKTKVANGRQVRGILVASGVTDSLRMSIAAVPNLELWTYEISFALRRELPAGIPS